MSSFIVIIIVIIALVVIFLLLREINCWYWKINERVALMQEQNNLLRKLISGNAAQESLEAITTISEKPIVEGTNYSAPQIISQNKTAESSFRRGKYVHIQIEFADGVKGSIFHQSENEYYFKDSSGKHTVIHLFDSFENCANAFHYFEKTYQLLKVGFIGSFPF